MLTCLGENFADYCEAIIETGISTLPGPQFPVDPKPWYHGTVTGCREALNEARPILGAFGDHLPQDIVRPVLNHPDLHMGNIIVALDNPTVILGIIGWQSASIEPAFRQMRRIPDFARQTDSESANHATLYRNYIERHHPWLYQAMNVNKHLNNLFSTCLRAWRYGFVIQGQIAWLSWLWERLGFDLGPYPHGEISEDWRNEYMWRYNAYSETKHIHRTVARLLKTGLRDGFRVRFGELETTRDLNKSLFYGYLWFVQARENNRSARPPMSTEELRSVWPYDVD